MDIADILQASTDFGKRLDQLKQSVTEFPWYPYNSLANIPIINQLLTDSRREMFSHNPLQSTVIDVGAGDGDVGFLFESLGCRVDLLDNPQTNFNDCNGIRQLRRLLRSKVRLIEQDVDFYFKLERNYDFGIALGILYHLRNPFAFLISLAQRCQRLLLSTRVAKVMNEHVVKDSPVAYLLEAREANGDPTCYWIFSEAGLMRLLRRAGWMVLDKLSIGCEEASNPVDNERDERMFIYAERVPNFAELLKHHDF
jgi:tRNA (mo5U34)-methyltransferase